MLAKDVMTSNVVCVLPETQVMDIVKLLLERHISAVPVVTAEGRLVGIVSEGDLIRRHEIDSEHRYSWWMSFFVASENRTQEYIKEHGQQAQDVMTVDVVTIGEEEPLGEVAKLLDERRIKRVPVVRAGKLVGIVSRSNLLQGVLAVRQAGGVGPTPDDRLLRERIISSLIKDTATHIDLLNLVVTDGIVHLWGAADSERGKRAIHLAAESIEGVRGVENHLGVLPGSVRAALWAE